MASLPKRKTSVGCPPSDDEVIHEGRCIKESGTAFLGKTNWRKRWFKLVKRGNTTLLQYFKSRTDRTSAGGVKLDVTYCTRQVEIHEKNHPNCFAVGPLVDDGAIRTYYISCPNKLAMQEWMAVIDAAIQGVPEQAQRRRETINHQFRMRHKPEASASPQKSFSKSDSAGSLGAESLDGFTVSVQLTSSVAEEHARGATVEDSLERDDLSDDEVWESVEDEVSDEEEEEERGGASLASAQHRVPQTADSSLTPTTRRRLYDDQRWRMEQWRALCHTAKSAKWSKVDTKDGVTVARCKFGRSGRGYAVIKVEGMLPADPSTVYQFLQLSMREGGKLDYLFRNENPLQDVAGEPVGIVITNHFLLPLPRVSQRDIVAMKLWVPPFLTHDDSSGFVMFSVDHPEAAPPEKDARRIVINPSGLILRLRPGPGGALHTHTVILAQVALQGALHRMLKGAYNSGLLKLGLRTTFSHIAEQLERFVEVTNI